MDEKIKGFVTKFFESMKAEIVEETDGLIVKNVSESFEKFYGKKGPYKFSFNGEKEGYEQINKGSFLLKAINDFLEGRGQTTILKIDFNFNPQEKIEQDYKLVNCEINRANKSHKNDYILRFTFSTNFQYLNEKEQIINNVLVKRGKILDFDLDELNVIQGNQKEAVVTTLDKDYAIAKEKLKEMLKDKTENISKEIGLMLDKEVERIKEHYKNQTKEIDDNILDNKKRLERLEKERDEAILRGTNYDIENYNKRKERFSKEIEKNENSEDKSKAKNEEESLIKEEIQKHTLNIKTKLINTTIIYYPIFSSEVIIKNSHSARIIQFSFDPLYKDSSPIRCDSCKKEIKDIILCDSGHLTCDKCGTKCTNCGGIYLEESIKKICSTSGRKICDKCAVRCSGCGKFYSKQFITKTYNGKDLCNSCMGVCSICGRMNDPDKIIVREGKKICTDCIKEEIKNKTLKGIFRR